MEDSIIRAVAKDAPIRAAAITARGMAERARQIHHTLPVATAALGRCMMAASLLGSQLKEPDGSLTLRIKGDGPLEGITVVSDSAGNVRGYVVNPQTQVPSKAPGKLDVGRAVGRGTLTIIKDLRLKEPYVGTIPLVSGEIAEDITAYLAESEQIPSACALGVLVDRDQSVLQAGGYLLQLLPGAEPELAARLEANVAALGPVSRALEDGCTGQALLERVLNGFTLEILASQPVAYQCHCTRERVSRALISLGRQELEEMIREQGGAEITCQFCDKIYRFTAEELEALLAESSGDRPGK